MPIEVTQQDKADWKNHPITKNLINACAEHIENLEELLKSRNIDQSPTHRAYAIGLIQGLEAVSNYDVPDEIDLGDTTNV